MPTEPDPQDLIEYAWQAFRHSDWDEAERRWAAVRARLPEAVIGYAAAVTTLREAGRFDDAEVMVRQTLARFPDEVSAHAEWAWLDLARGRLLESLDRWATVRQRFPDHWGAFIGISRAYYRLGRAAEAEAALREATETFPDSVTLWCEFANAATNRQDWSEVDRRWAIVRQRFPDETAGYAGAIYALRDQRRFAEAEALLDVTIERFPEDVAMRCERAWLAQFASNWPATVERWAEVRKRFPDVIAAYLQGANALAELWRLNEAEALLAEAMDRFPESAEPPVQHAWLAMRENRWNDAGHRFARLRDRFPNQADGWLGGAQVLRNEFDFQSANTLLEQGMQRFPNDPRLALEYARVPIDPAFAEQKDWPETFRRIERLVRNFPDYETGLISAAHLLMQGRHLDRAETLVKAAVANLPGSSALASVYAELAEDRRDWPAAIERYTAVREKFPDQPAGEAGLARALAGMERFDEAEAMILATIERFPNRPEPLADYARFAMRQENWAAAVRRWIEVTTRFPEQKHYLHELYDARMRLADSDPEAANQLAHLTAAPMPDPTRTDQSVRDLAMQFENLGGRGLGCEFGIFQRDCGAEPLGLLRWADMPYDMLVTTLRNRFEGVGSEENTEVFINNIGGGRGEYCTRDRRGMMFMRTFIYEDQEPLEKVSVTALNRLRFLTRELIGDLEDGTKIFVFRLTDRNLTPEEIDDLYDAMREYGDNTLLYVRYEDEEHPNGTVELVKPGLLIGYIDRFKLGRDNHLSAAPPTGSWLTICRNALALWRQPAIAAPDIVAAPVGTRRSIVFAGDRQARVMAGLYKSFVAARTGDRISYVVDAREAFDRADLIVEQRTDDEPLPTSNPRLFMPLVSGRFLFPLSGEAHPSNPVLPWFPEGPYGPGLGDTYLNRAIVSGIDPVDAVETYLRLDIDGLKDRYDETIAAQRARDRASDHDIASIIETHLRDEPLFLTAEHPELRISLALATRLFSQLGAEQRDIDALIQQVRVTPFPKTALPIHPSVARHFRLPYVSADRCYPFLEEGSFDVRTFASRYMRCEWNRPLAEGLYLAENGDPATACDALIEGLMHSPASPAGHRCLADVLAKLGEDDAAAAAAKHAVGYVPDVAYWRIDLDELPAAPVRKQSKLERFLLAHGSEDEVKEALLEAVALDPGSHLLRDLLHALRAGSM